MKFGEKIEGIPYRVLDERKIRATSGIMFLIGAIASINGFIFARYYLLPYFIGFLFLNFFLSFINPKLSPVYQLGRLFTRKQTPLYVGAIQKRFAWALGSMLSLYLFIQSFFLIQNPALFEHVCSLCLICLLLLFLETSFGICIGCKIYFWSMRLGIIKKPDVKPTCMGDACAI